PTTSPLTVNYTLGGTAVNGVDYQLVATSVTLGDLTPMTQISIVPIADGIAEPTETVTLTITSNNAYVIGGSAGAQVSIADAPPQVLTTNFGFQSAPFTLDYGFSVSVAASL